MMALAVNGSVSFLVVYRGLHNLKFLQGCQEQLSGNEGQKNDSWRTRRREDRQISNSLGDHKTTWVPLCRTGEKWVKQQVDLQTPMQFLFGVVYYSP